MTNNEAWIEFRKLVTSTPRSELLKEIEEIQETEWVNFWTETVTLDGSFTIEELLVIAAWLLRKPE